MAGNESKKPAAKKATKSPKMAANKPAAKTATMKGKNYLYH